MAFNGITVACLVNELNGRLSGGRISKIVQTESDELMITVRTAAESGGGQARVLLSADASLPLLYLTDSNKPAPATAPAFCMLLRKHIGAGRILSVTQPGLERVIRFR
ncbi:MAG: NFACT family protein, partial [Lachnospiraceae bacterium]|nr:NFACT family protein [Lachnospiraceae bacterium]